jgi:hypothetical protein
MVKSQLLLQRRPLLLRYKLKKQHNQKPHRLKKLQLLQMHLKLINKFKLKLKLKNKLKHKLKLMLKLLPKPKHKHKQKLKPLLRHKLRHRLRHRHKLKLVPLLLLMHRLLKLLNKTHNF